MMHSHRQRIMCEIDNSPGNNRVVVNGCVPMTHDAGTCLPVIVGLSPFRSVSGRPRSCAGPGMGGVVSLVGCGLWVGCGVISPTRPDRNETKRGGGDGD